MAHLDPATPPSPDPAPAGGGGSENRRVDPVLRKLQIRFALVFMIAGAACLTLFILTEQPAGSDPLIRPTEARTAVSLFLGMMLMSVGVAMVFYAIFESTTTFKDSKWSVGGAFGIFALLVFGLNLAGPRFYDSARRIEAQSDRIQELAKTLKEKEAELVGKIGERDREIGKLGARVEELAELKNIYRTALTEGPRNIHFRVACHLAGRRAMRNSFGPEDGIFPTSASLRHSERITFGTDINGNIQPDETRFQESTKPAGPAIEINFRDLLRKFEGMENLNIFVFWYKQLREPTVINGMEIKVVPDGHEITLLLADRTCQ